MEKAEVMGYLSLGVFVAILVFSIYTLNFQTTGFAVFSQNDLSSFNVSGATFENVSYNTNLSAITLDENQSSGLYTSAIYDAGNNSVWNNLTYAGNGIINFEVRSCSTIDCSNSSFGSADLNAINLTGQYFQYRASFSSNDSSLSSVNLDYSIVEEEGETETLTITISEPSGEKTSATNVPIQFTLSRGENYTCWYNLRDASDNALLTDNTTISDCSNNTNVTFNAGVGDGSYIFNIYANSSLGLYNNTAAFTVNLGSDTEEEEEEADSIAATTESESESESESITSITLQKIETVKLNPSESYNYNLVTLNSGDNSVSSCELKATGDFASWLNLTSASKNINSGSQENFAFILNVPGNSTLGSHEFKLSVICAETLGNLAFNVDVVKKTLEFNITDVERTRDDNVRVRYSLKDLSGEEQNITFNFLILNSANKEVANASENYTLPPNSTKKLTVNIPVNESLNGTLTLSVNYNSKEDSYSVREPITLGSPTGLAILDDLGTGGIVAIGAGIIIVIVVIFFVVRRARGSKPQKSAESK